MNPSFVRFATIAILAVGALAQSFTVNTPSNVVVCQPVQISWSGGAAPYFVSIFDGANPTGTSLRDLGQQDGTSVTWLVDLEAGRNVGVNVRDSAGALAQTAAFQIQSSPNTDCLTAAPSPTGSGSGTPSPTGATPAPTGASPTPTAPTNTGAPATTRTNSGSGAATGSGTGAAPQQSQSGGAVSQAISLGVVGFVNAAIMAILA